MKIELILHDGMIYSTTQKEFESWSLEEMQDVLEGGVIVGIQEVLE